MVVRFILVTEEVADDADPTATGDSDDEVCIIPGVRALDMF